MSVWRSQGRSRGLWCSVRTACVAAGGGRGFRSGGSQYDWRTRNKTVLAYVTAAGVGMVGMSYAAVRLYRMYCQEHTAVLFAQKIVGTQ